MDPVTFITAAIGLVKLGAEIEPLAQQIYDAVTKPGGPTADDWTALHATEAALRERLGKEPGAV